MFDEPRIDVCPHDQREAALRILHDGLPDDQQTALVQALDAARGAGEQIFDGLLAARDATGDLQGVVWVQLMPGRTALLWPPSAGSLAAAGLLDAATEFLDQQAVVLAQLLVKPDSPTNTSTLEAAGFRMLADLAYLTVDHEFFPAAEPDAVLQFEPHAADHPDRLGNLLIDTYQGTLDCPALNELRDPADIVAGYAAQGESAAQRWFFVRHDAQDVGVLLLTMPAGGENCELVYMGVVPAARGLGFGWQILQFALWQAGCGGAERMVLAVDEKNRHALQTYRRAGMVVWDRRTVYARMGLGQAKNT